MNAPPHAETEARIAVRAARLVVVPVQPSPLDLWATAETLKMAQKRAAAPHCRGSQAVVSKSAPIAPNLFEFATLKRHSTPQSAGFRVYPRAWELAIFPAARTGWDTILAAAGINKNLAHRARAAAAIPEAEFDRGRYLKSDHGSLWAASPGTS